MQKNDSSINKINNSLNNAGWVILLIFLLFLSIQMLQINASLKIIQKSVKELEDYAYWNDLRFIDIMNNSEYLKYLNK